jgi:hypothetical protein
MRRRPRCSGSSGRRLSASRRWLPFSIRTGSKASTAPHRRISPPYWGSCSAADCWPSTRVRHCLFARARPIYPVNRPPRGVAQQTEPQRQRAARRRRRGIAIWTARRRPGALDPPAIGPVVVDMVADRSQPIFDPVHPASRPEQLSGNGGWRKQFPSSAAMQWLAVAPHPGRIPASGERVLSALRRQTRYAAPPAARGRRAATALCSPRRQHIRAVPGSNSRRVRSTPPRAR